MKIIIVGLHDSGKQEIREFMKQQGLIACSKFSSDPEAYDEYFEPQIVKEIFDNNSYLYIDTFFESTNDLFVGATMESFDKCDFITLTPREMMQIPSNRNLGEVCIIWLDNTRANRYKHWKETNSTIGFNEQEEFEKQYMTNFTDFVYKFQNSHLIYFNNEEPLRAAAVATAIHKVPMLLPMFEKSFK